jgi:alkylation response protein AidB-like acyl-CoA dehydrogenase
MASVQGALVMYPIHAYGSEAQKEEWLPKLGEGEAVGCFGLTEPEHGSNPTAMETRAEAEDEGYLLNGSKTWITNSPIADVAVVWARDRSDPDTPVRGFLVETDRDGVTTNKIDDKMSLRASITGEIGLNDVYVPESNVLPDVKGMKGPLSCLTQARYGIAWGAVGAARDCFEEARQYALDRDQFGGPIAQFQLQQRKLAEMATQITLSQLLAHRLAELKEQGEMRAQHVSMAKRNNVRMARDQSRIAREMLGGNGITGDYSPMRHMANLETVYTYEGTHDIQTGALPHVDDGVLAAEAVAAVDLHCHVGRFAGGLRGPQFRHVREFGDLLAVVAVVHHPRGLADEQVCGFELRPRVGDRVLDGLVGADRLVEDLPLVGVLDRPVQGVAARADAPRRADQPLGVDRVEQLVQPHLLRADDVRLGGDVVVEGELELPLRGGNTGVQFPEFDRRVGGVGQEHRDAHRSLVHLLDWRRARHQ